VSMRLREFDNITNEQIASWIDSYIHSERDRLLLKRKLCDGIPFDPLSEEFDLSVRQTKYIVAREKERLLHYLKA